MDNTPRQAAAFPMFGIASIVTAAISVIAGVTVAQIRGCNPWIGCVFVGVLVGVGFALLGLIFGIVSWKKAESRNELAVIGMLLNLIPLLIVLFFLIKIITK